MCILIYRLISKQCYTCCVFFSTHAHHYIFSVLLIGNKKFLTVTALFILMNDVLFNPLNAELNPTCHLIILLEDLTFISMCIVSIFQYTCISNKMQRYTVYLYLETALHVLGGTSTNHQERIQLYLQHLVFVTPLPLSAALVEELEPV
jgi:hypothetical protein